MVLEASYISVHVVSIWFFFFFLIFGQPKCSVESGEWNWKWSVRREFASAHTVKSKATDSWHLWYFSTSAKFSQPGQSSGEDLKGKETGERWQYLNANLNHPSPFPSPLARESVRLCSFK